MGGDFWQGFTQGAMAAGLSYAANSIANGLQEEHRYKKAAEQASEEYAQGGRARFVSRYGFGNTMQARGGPFFALPSEATYVEAAADVGEGFYIITAKGYFPGHVAMAMVFEGTLYGLSYNGDFGFGQGVYSFMERMLVMKDATLLVTKVAGLGGQAIQDMIGAMRTISQGRFTLFYNDCITAVQQVLAAGGLPFHFGATPAGMFYLFQHDFVTYYGSAYNIQNLVVRSPQQTLAPLYQ
jgi:hypothetical protein